MKKLLDWANDCIRRWSWKDVALLKLCMLALGVLAGLALPRRAHREARTLCGGVFLLTWVILMADFLNSAPFWQEGAEAAAPADSAE